MNQVNMEVADVRYQKTESKKNTKDVNDNKDAFKSVLEERYEMKDTSKKPSGKEEQESLSDDSKLPGTTNEAALLSLQMGQIIPDYLVHQVIPEETGEIVQPMQLVAPVDEESSSTVPVMDVDGTEQPQLGADTEAEAVDLSVNNGKDRGKETGIILDGIKPEEAKETVDIKLPEEQLKAVGEEETKGGRLSEEQPEAARETEGTSYEVQNVGQPEAGQTAAVSNVRHESNVQESQTTEHVHVSKPEEIPQKLTEELVVKTSKGVKEFEIQLEPANLGKIAIKVNYEQGQTIISILCTEKRTLELISHNAREIGYVMEQNLGDTTTVYVDKQENDYLHQQGRDQDHTGRDSEQERQREENRKNQTDDSHQFIQKLRLGLMQ